MVVTGRITLTAWPIQSSQPSFILASWRQVAVCYQATSSTLPSRRTHLPVQQHSPQNGLFHGGHMPCSSSNSTSKKPPGNTDKCSISHSCPKSQTLTSGPGLPINPRPMNLNFMEYHRINQDRDGQIGFRRLNRPTWTVQKPQDQ